MPGNPGKKGEVGGVSGGRRQGPHYACLEVEVRRRRSKRAKSCPVGKCMRAREARKGTRKKE